MIFYKIARYFSFIFFFLLCYKDKVYFKPVKVTERMIFRIEGCYLNVCWLHKSKHLVGSYGDLLTLRQIDFLPMYMR